MIFSASLLYEIKTGWGLWGPKYNRCHIDNVLKELLGDTKLSQILKPCVVVSYSLDWGGPHMWSTHHALKGSNDDCYIRDIAGATSAAPTYFAPKVIRNEYTGNVLHEVDGGIWANNPESTAIQAMKLFREKISDKDVMLVSIGTGVVRKNKKMFSKQIRKLKQAGILGWLIGSAPNLIEMMIGADSDWSKSLTSLAYPDNYRIEISVPQELSSMDNYKNVEKLQLLAEKYTESPEFKNICNKLLQN